MSSTFQSLAGPDNQPRPRTALEGAEERRTTNTAADDVAAETLWHVSVLSNFPRGYDKYQRRYSKLGIPESSFPDRFFLLTRAQLKVGIEKTLSLRARIGLEGDQIIALRTRVPIQDLQPNLQTGIGRFVMRDWIALDGVFLIDEQGNLAELSTEEAMAKAFGVLNPILTPYTELSPRSLSVLPIGQGCQANCPFCFSKASASADQTQARLSVDLVAAIAKDAKNRGAERFVITGGGEPALAGHESLLELMKIGSASLSKSVMITNGHHLAKLDESTRAQTLLDYANAGLGVLSISSHHYDPLVNAGIMGLGTDVASIAKTWRLGQARWENLNLRAICVLQTGGIDTPRQLKSYLDWAVSLGIKEICFKELYVSTSSESYYHQHAANRWSQAHQVPLSLILEFARRHRFEELVRLPWNSPIFIGEWNEMRIQVAAYTEPSLLWERSHGIARSWNLMSDGLCLASLEDRNSVVANTSVR